MATDSHWYDRDGRTPEQITEDAIAKLKADFAKLCRPETPNPIPEGPRS